MQLNIKVQEEKVEQKEFDLLPDGKYTFVVNKSEAIYRDSDRKVQEEYNADTKEVLVNFEFEVVSDQYKSRRIWQDFTVQYDLPPIEYADKKTGAKRSFDPSVAGRGQLAALADACGIGDELMDSSQLDNATFIGSVVTKKSKDPKYKDKNQISKFYNIDESVPDETVAAPVTAVAKPAWKK
jgi:hypothetical protein